MNKKRHTREGAKLAVKLNLAITFSWWLFSYAESKEEAPRKEGQAKLFLNTVNHIKQIDKTSILMKFLNTFIG